MKELNKILLRRKNKLIINDSANKENNLNLVATIMANIENLGYLMSRDLICKLMYLSSTELIMFEIKLIRELKELIGYRNYRPMYPNFPQQVMEMDYVELYINAIVHYITKGEVLPEYEKESKKPLINQTKYTILDIAKEQDVRDLFYGLVNSKTSLSDTDKSDLLYLIKNESDEYNLELPDIIPFKETMAIICALELTDYPKAAFCEFYLKTPTDILRTITAYSGGDVSLATNTKFKSMKRKDRKLFLYLLDNCSNLEEDMDRYINKWIKVGEMLHPSEYKQYKNVNKAFDKIRNNIKIMTFNREVDLLLKNKDYDKLLNKLAERPSEFARKINLLYMRGVPGYKIISKFNDIVEKVSSNILLNLISFCWDITEGDLEYRMFLPKGKLAKAFTIENNYKNIDWRAEHFYHNIIGMSQDALINIYSKRDEMGNVYINKEFKNYLVPFSQRSASKALKTITRGSKLPIETTTNFLRPFIYWKNNNERVDLDLSANIYNNEFELLKTLSYMNLRLDNYNCSHSGDIVSSEKGASEFVNIDINKTIENKGRYVLFTVHNYTGQPFIGLEECMFGVMERDNEITGEIYEPKTVKNTFDLTADSTISLPIVFDLVNREFIWLDMNLKNSGGINNLKNTGNKILPIIKSFIQNNKPNLYDLIELNVTARGTLVDDKSQADIIFDIDEGITPFDTEKFMSDFI